MDRLLERFCVVDDFVQLCLPELSKTWLPAPPPHGERPSMHLSEVMTILVQFHFSGCRHFKSYYTNVVQKYLKSDFPGLVSYSRFIELIPRTLIFMTLFLNALLGTCTGISIVDATAMRVCHFKRAKRNRVFKGLAAFGKSSMGFFFGFKLHLVINHLGELLAVKLTPGNVDDRVPVPDFAEKLHGKLVGDKGYISAELAAKLRHLVELITPLRKNMKGRLVRAVDAALISKRALVETVIGQLKLVCHADHTRHRSPVNYMVNLLGGLIAYCLKPNKPSIAFNESSSSDAAVAA